MHSKRLQAKIFGEAESLQENSVHCSMYQTKKKIYVYYLKLIKTAFSRQVKFKHQTGESKITQRTRFKTFLG